MLSANYKHPLLDVNLAGLNTLAFTVSDLQAYLYALSTLAEYKADDNLLHSEISVCGLTPPSFTTTSPMYEYLSLRGFSRHSTT